MWNAYYFRYVFVGWKTCLICITCINNCTLWIDIFFVNCKHYVRREVFFSLKYISVLRTYNNTNHMQVMKLEKQWAMYTCGYKSDVNLTFISDESIGLESKVVIFFAVFVLVGLVVLIVILFKKEKGKGLHQLI